MTPRFNHVAMSVDRPLLEPVGRRDLLGFYGEVFGWTEMPTMSRDGELLVLRAHRNDQFVFLQAANDPMRCPSDDHVGFAVDTKAEFDAVLERARGATSRYADVEIRPEEPQDYGVLTLHACYIRYRLPLMFEVQCFEWAEGFDAESQPNT